MTHIYLASFLQPENFGPGKVFGIINTNGGKPKVKIDGIFEPVTPSIELIESYNKMRTEDAKGAGEMFVTKYQAQLDNFYDEVDKVSKESGKSMCEVLPFQDGDTLASWERAEFTNYRKLLAPYLEKMGFKVVLK